MNFRWCAYPDIRLCTFILGGVSPHALPGVSVRKSPAFFLQKCGIFWKVFCFWPAAVTSAQHFQSRCLLRLPLKCRLILFNKVMRGLSQPQIILQLCRKVWMPWKWIGFNLASVTTDLRRDKRTAQLLSGSPSLGAASKSSFLHM